ncbi:HlyD family type I secretion periplasmic adaptor subunit [Parapedomonas caeni]
MTTASTASATFTNPSRRLFSALPDLVARASGIGKAPSRLLSRSIMLEEAAPPRVMRWTIGAIAAVAAGFVGWSAVISLDELAAAPGQILPQSFVRPVQHLEGGIVAEVRVREGQTVKQGDPLIVLDDAQFAADLDQIRARHAALSFQAERLRAFALDREPRFDPRITGFDHLKQDQHALWSMQMENRRVQLAVAGSKVSESRYDEGSLAAREKALARELELAEEELGARRKLLDKGLTSRLTYLRSERDVSRLQGELADVRSQQKRARASVSGATGGRQEVAARLKENALQELGQVTVQLAEATEQLKRLEDKVRRLMVVAPVDGTVKGLQVTSAGAVIPPGSMVAEIVPYEDAVMAEVRVSPADIGHVQAGSPALVKVATYDFGRYGGVRGTVDFVSASSFLDEQGKPYFKARVKLERAYVGSREAGNVLSPGMTLVADIKTGEKSLLAYLVRPVTNALDTAFSER